MAACASGARTASAVTSWVKGCLATATASTLTSAVGVSSFALHPVSRAVTRSRAVATLAVLCWITRILLMVPSGTKASLLKFPCQGLQLSKGDVIADRPIDPGGLAQAVG